MDLTKLQGIAKQLVVNAKAEVAKSADAMATKYGVEPLVCKIILLEGVLMGIAVTESAVGDIAAQMQAA